MMSMERAEMPSLPPTVIRLLPCYRKLARGLGYVELRELVATNDYWQVRSALEREFVEQPFGWYFTTTRMGDDIQIQINPEALVAESFSEIREALQ